MISMLLIAVVATWLPLGPCCAVLACHGPRAPQVDRVAEHSAAVAPLGEEHAACHAMQMTGAPAPMAVKDAPSHDAPTRHAPAPTAPDCGCVDRLAPAPDADDVTAPSVGGSYPLPAFDLSTPTPWVADPPPLRLRSPGVGDAGPPPPRASLFAQACLLIV